MIRVAGVVLPQQKHLNIALRSIYGIGDTLSRQICDNLNMSYSIKVNQITEEEASDIQKEVAKLNVEGDLRRQIATSKKRLMDIKCYRGRRHRMSLPCRGQRTKTNARTRKGPRKGSIGSKKK